MLWEPDPPNPAASTATCRGVFPSTSTSSTVAPGSLSNWAPNGVWMAPPSSNDRFGATGLNRETPTFEWYAEWYGWVLSLFVFVKIATRCSELWLIQWSPAFRPMLEPRPIKVLFHTFVCVQFPSVHIFRSLACRILIWQLTSSLYLEMTLRLTNFMDFPIARPHCPARWPKA